MSTASSGSLDAVLRDLVDEQVAPLVRAQLPGADADAVLALLVDRVLPARLAYLPSLEEALRPGAIALTVDDALDELRGWPPSEWATRLTSAELMTRLAPASLRALEMARAILEDSGRRPALHDTASEVRAELDAIQAAAVAAGPECVAALAMEMNEARLDCDYVLRPAGVTSVRLAHYMGS